MVGIRKLAALVAVVAIAAAACSSAGASQAPATAAPATAAPATAAPATGAPASAGTGGNLTGSLVVWHSYGSGAGTEAAALKTVTETIPRPTPVSSRGSRTSSSPTCSRTSSRAARAAGPTCSSRPTTASASRPGTASCSTCPRGEDNLGNISELARRGLEGRRHALHDPRVPQGRGHVLQRRQGPDPADDH